GTAICQIRHFCCCTCPYINRCPSTNNQAAPSPWSFCCCSHNNRVLASPLHIDFTSLCHCDIPNFTAITIRIKIRCFHCYSWLNSQGSSGAHNDFACHFICP